MSCLQLSLFDKWASLHMLSVTNVNAAIATTWLPLLLVRGSANSSGSAAQTDSFAPFEEVLSYVSGLKTSGILGSAQITLQNFRGLAKRSQTRRVFRYHSRQGAGDSTASSNPANERIVARSN